METPVVHAPASGALASARRTLAIESRAVGALAERLDQGFESAVALILACRGRVVVSGIGKSGHVARKIASTLASTGTPSFFVHPAEASHGDLGMITGEDVVVALSNSGESAEVLAVIPLIKRRGARLIAISGNPRSTLALQADLHLDSAVAEEACPLGLAPTASTTAALALGDALAVALLEARGFGAEDFARSHPGGELGRRLLTRVSDVMRSGEALPVVAPGVALIEAVREISRKGMGMAAVLQDDGRLAGVLTDGDLRRALERGVDPGRALVETAMTASPQTVGPGELAQAAVKLMEDRHITQVLVVDEDRRLVGALNLHDLFRARVV